MMQQERRNKKKKSLNFMLQFKNSPVDYNFFLNEIFSKPDGNAKPQQQQHTTSSKSLYF